MVSKKKSSNPLDAHRKAARSRELQKNKEQRDKAREISLVKRDTHGIEKEIQQLQSKDPRSAEDEKELSKLLSDVKRIKQAKEEYLSKHPEHRKFVYPKEAEAVEDRPEKSEGDASRVQKQPPIKDSRRSIYYDAVFNPFGAAPPGMPYMEKPDVQWDEEQRKVFQESLGSDEMNNASDEGDEEDDDESKDSDASDDMDDIVMPEGPPPLPLAAEEDSGVEALEEVEDSSSDEDGIVMPEGSPPAPPSAPKAMLRAPAGSIQSLPSRPMSTWQPPLPPTPPSNASLAASSVARPGNYSTQSMPHMQSLPIARPPMPPQSRPTPRPSPAASATVITSAPVLRDLRKEATAFVPTALRKKQATQK